MCEHLIPANQMQKVTNEQAKVQEFIMMFNDYVCAAADFGFTHVAFLVQRKCTEYDIASISPYSKIFYDHPAVQVMYNSLDVIHSALVKNGYIVTVEEHNSYHNIKKYVISW